MPALLSGFRKSFLSRIINKKTFIKKVIRKMVPKAGLEPARYRYRWILSPLRLPVSPLGHLLNYYNIGFVKCNTFFEKS